MVLVFNYVLMCKEIYVKLECRIKIRNLLQFTNTRFWVVIGNLAETMANQLNGKPLAKI